MTVSAFRHVFSSGVLLLLAMATTTLVVQRVDGATTLLSTASTSECATEVEACSADVTCANCILTFLDSSQEISDCLIELGHDEIESSTATCSDNMEVYCCFDEVAEEECLENDEFVEYSLCQLGTVGCTDDEITCSGASSTFGGLSKVVALFGGFTALLPLLL